MGCIPNIFYSKTGTNVQQKNGVSKRITANDHIQSIWSVKRGAEVKKVHLSRNKTYFKLLICAFDNSRIKTTFVFLNSNYYRAPVHL